MITLGIEHLLKKMKMKSSKRILDQIDAIISSHKIEINSNYGIGISDFVDRLNKLNRLGKRKQRVLKLNKIQELCQQQMKM